jgi:hypothetical protein
LAGTFLPLSGSATEGDYRRKKGTVKAGGSWEKNRQKPKELPRYSGIEARNVIGMFS